MKIKDEEERVEEGGREDSHGTVPFPPPHFGLIPFVEQTGVFPNPCWQSLG